jgi:hypothetical protein
MDIVTLALAKKYADSVAGAGSNITIDDTLTKEGQAADAKVVGDALSEKASEDYVTQQIGQLSFEDIGSDVSATAETLGSGTSATVSIEGNIFHFGIPKGDTGAQGPAGPKGEDGKGVTILGSYDSSEQLFEEHPTGNIGDSYLVNGDLYVWSETETTWKNVGTIEGPQGPQGEKGDKGDPGADGADGLTTAIALQKSEGDTTTYEQVDGTITLTGDNIFNAFNMGTYTLDEFRAQASKGFIISRLTLPQEIRGHLELLGGTIVRNGLNVNDSYLYVKSNVEVDFSAGNGNYVRINNGLLSFLGTGSGDLKAQWQQSLGIPTDAIGQATADSRYLAASLKGAVNGVATLDGNSKLTASQFPNPNNVGVYSLNVGSNIPSNADLNEYVTPGTYSAANSSIASTLSNTPVTDTGFKLVVQYNQGTANGAQYVFQNEKVYSRSMAGNPISSFGAWKILLAADSPSYGSNANGSWQKLPGNIMIAWGAKNTDTIQSNSWTDTVFNFPLAFSSPPLVIAAQRYDAQVRDITLNVGGSSTDGAWCHVYYGGTNPNAVTINWMAIGSY